MAELIDLRLEAVKEFIDHGFSELASSLPLYYRLIIACPHTSVNFEFNEDTDILLLTNEENHFKRRRSWMNETKLLIRNSTSRKSQLNFKTKPIPYNIVRDFDVKNFSERDLDLFFSGNLGHDEVGPGTEEREFMKEVTSKLDIPNSFINWTDGFYCGLEPEDYDKMLVRSRFALVPVGVHCPDSYRIIECLKSGTVPITTYKPIPELDFYKDMPSIQLDSWSDLDPGILDMSGSEWTKLSNDCIKFYEENLSIEAISSKVNDYIKDFYN